MLFVICVAVLVIVSFLTDPPIRAKIAGLTCAHADEEVHSTTERERIAADLTSDPLWRRWDLILTVALLACVAALWLYFTG